MSSLRPIEKEASEALEQKNYSMKVIRYNEWLICHPDVRNVVYELCKDDFKKIREISKEEARELIKENDLKMVHFNRYGAIWS